MRERLSDKIIGEEMYDASVDIYMMLRTEKFRRRKGSTE